MSRRPTKRAARPAAPADVPELRSWLLVYKPAGTALRMPWLVVDDVPADLQRPDVLEALQLWRLWSRYAPLPGGTTTLLPAGKWGALDVSRATHVGWEALAPELRRVGLIFSPPDHALVTLAARQRGQSLAVWATQALAAAAAQQLGGQAPPPAAGAHVVDLTAGDVDSFAEHADTLHDALGTEPATSAGARS